MQQELQSTESILRDLKRGYAMVGLLCMDCERVHPDTARKCHHCNNADLQSRQCTSDFRVAEYFAVLRRSELWPAIEPFTSCTLSDIALRFQNAQKDKKHQCDAISDCPLKTQVDALCRRVHLILERMKGISIDGRVVMPNATILQHD